MPAYIPFLRVSTDKQTTDRQLAEITARAQREGWELAPPIMEVVSGKKKNSARAGLQQLLATAKRKDTVIVTEISRLGRSTTQLLQVVDELTERGVAVLALNTGLSSLDKDGKRNPAASLIFVVLAEVARLEVEFLCERVNSGLASARSQGRIGGRPKEAIKDTAQLLRDHADVVRALQANQSIRDVANVTKKSPTTVNKVRKALLAEMAVSST